MTLKYNLVQNGEQGALTAFFNGEMYTADDTHASWAQLVSAVTSPDPDLTALGRLFDPAVGIQNYFKRVSERVSVAGGHVFIDGEEINDGLANNIIRFMNEDKNDKAMALVNFLEKVSTNLNEHSREQLYDFLSRHDFAINDAGNFLAYKGVVDRRGGENLDKYPYESSSSGKAIVDGQVFTGRIPNGLGAVVEMPRGEVQHDPSVGCHTGLHAGTYEYASTFTHGPCLLVEINPRDVVSVPTDCNWQKIRTCRYTVVEVIGNKLTDMYYGSADYADELDEDYSPDEPYYGSEDESWDN